MTFGFGAFRGEGDEGDGDDEGRALDGRGHLAGGRRDAEALPLDFEFDAGDGAFEAGGDQVGGRPSMAQAEPLGPDQEVARAVERPHEGYLPEDALGDRSAPFRWHELDIAGVGGADAGGGLEIERARRGDLDDLAGFHDGDAVGDGHGIGAVVGDEEGGHPFGAEDGGDFVAHLHAEAGIEVGEGLIEEEDAGMRCEGAEEGNALLLAAGELVGVPVAEPFEVGHAEELFDAAAFAALESVADVPGDGEVGEEGVFLEDEADGAAVGGHVVVGAFDELAGEANLPGGDAFEAGDGAEQGSFAAAAPAEERDEFAGCEAERGSVDGPEAAVANVDGGDAEGFARRRGRGFMIRASQSRLSRPARRGG